MLAIYSPVRYGSYDKSLVSCNTPTKANRAKAWDAKPRNLNSRLAGLPKA